MALFKKKKKDLPDLPKPSLDLGIEKLKFPDLPKFPEPEVNEEGEEGQFPPLYRPTIPPRSVNEEDEELMEEEEEVEQIKDKPLFIKIEKYENAMRDMEEIQNRIKDATQILNNLRQIKSEEDSEIKKWEDDLLSIKNKLIKIDKNLFGV